MALKFDLYAAGQLGCTTTTRRGTCVFWNKPRVESVSPGCRVGVSLREWLPAKRDKAEGPTLSLIGGIQLHTQLRGEILCPTIEYADNVSLTMERIIALPLIPNRAFVN